MFENLVLAFILLLPQASYPYEQPDREHVNDQPLNCGFERRGNRYIVRDETCGNIPVNQIANGDPNFRHPRYTPQMYPPGTKVQVVTFCDTRSRKFYTRVGYKTPGSAIWRPFVNPYPLRDGRRNVPYTDSNGFRGEAWLTSPGAYSADNRVVTINGVRTHTGSNTHVRRLNRGITRLTELHKVTANKAWQGAKMPWAVYFEGDFAYHASSNVSGRGESKGCPRLEMGNAQALFNLVRRVGTANVSVVWDSDEHGNVDYKNCTLPPLYSASSDPDTPQAQEESRP